jgi:ketosteroid isomerase-like protein
MIFIRVLLVVVFAILSFPPAASSERFMANVSLALGPKNTADEVRQTLSNFLSAFENLDWEPFRNSFADDATVYFPSQRATRATGRAEVDATFRQVFERIRATTSGPPYLNLKPVDLDVQLFHDIGIVTFQLHDLPNVIGRRTVVLEKRSGEWKIVHLHASNVQQAQR